MIIKQIVIGILAHVDAGKTTLSEGMLYLSGKIKKLGRVDHQDAFLDTHALERARGITIFSKQAVFSGANCRFTLLDTPGHIDFSAEMERTLQVMDYAILVISGVDGVQTHTETLWKLLRRYRIPTFLFVTKMDQPGADHAARMQELKERLSDACVDFSAGGSAKERAEAIACCEEALLERYLETGSIAISETAELIRTRRLFPCYFGSGLRLDGVEAFLDGLEVYTQPPIWSESFSARVYKISRDAQGNRMTHVKITGGELRVRTPLRYRKKEEWLEEKVTQIRIYSGAKYETAEAVLPGCCCCLLGLSETYPGQGLGESEKSVSPLLEPVMTYRMGLPPQVDARLLLPKLKQLEEEDPQLHLVWQEQLQEIHVQLMGEVQIDVLKSLIRERFDVEVTIDSGCILYKETIAQPVEGVGHFEPLRHYAEVHLLMEPLPAGSGIEIGADCSSEMLSEGWQRLVQTHLAEKMHVGVLTGAPLTDVRLTLVAGRAHLKHTEGGDFRQATYRAVRQGLMQAKNVLLEPIYAFRLEVGPEQIGRAISDIQAMSGTFSPPESIEDGRMMRLTGCAPVSKMQGYPAQVISYTHGRGRFSMSVQGYAPCHNAEEVIAAKNYQPEADADNPADSVFCAHGAGFLVKWNHVKEYMHVESGLHPVQQPDGTFLLKREPAQQSPRICSRNFHIEQKELDAILAREFGPPREIPRARPPQTPSAQQAQERVPAYKREFLIVDGYNVLFAWESLKKVASEDLAAARQQLMDRLCNFCGYVSCELILVFDGYLVPDNPGEAFDYHGIHVVYTKEKETGDLYIERLAGEIGKNERVRVVTSDRMIQLAAFRSGVLRMSARELEERVCRVEQQISEVIAKNRFQNQRRAREKNSD